MCPEDLYNLGFVGDVSVSPDARRIAYSYYGADRNRDIGRIELWLVGVDGGPSRRLTDGDHDRSPRWSPDGRLISFLREDGGVAQVWTVDPDSGNAQRLASGPNGVSAARWSPDQSHLAYLAMVDLEESEHGRDPIVIDRLLYKADGAGFFGQRRSHLFVTSTESGAVRQLTHGDFHVTTLAWSPDGTSIAFTAATHSSGDLDGVVDLHVIGRDGGEHRRVTDWSGVAGPAAWTPDGARLVFTGSRSPVEDEQLTLFLVDASGGKPELVAPQSDYHISGGLIGATEPVVSSDGRTVMVPVAVGSNVHVMAFALDGGGVRSVFGSPDTEATSWSTSPDGSIVAVSFGDPLTPGDVGIAHPTGASVRRLTDINRDALRDVVVLLQQRKVFTAADGTELEGFITVDPDGPSGPRPLLLDIHGGPHSVWSGAFRYWPIYHQPLAARGWAVLTVNPRGSGGYGRAFYSAVSHSWGQHDYGDLMAAVDSLIADGTADPDRLAVAGYSYGGYMTNLVTTRTDRFKAAVTGGGFCNNTSFAGTAYHGPSAMRLYHGVSLDQGPEAYRERSPLTCADRVCCPVLILHGGADWVAPVSQAEEWFAALRSQGKQTRLVVYPGADHMFPILGRPSHRVDYADRVVDWLTGYVMDQAE